MATQANVRRARRVSQHRSLIRHASLFVIPLRAISKCYEHPRSCTCEQARSAALDRAVRVNCVEVRSGGSYG